MPEGPTIVILKEEVQSFKQKKITGVSGNSRLDLQYLKGKRITDFKSWGKHFLICLDGFAIRIHFLLFGSYLVNESKPTTPRVSLQFKKGFKKSELNFYNCSAKIIEEPLDEVYDWTADVMNPLWDADKAAKKLKGSKHIQICDALLDQDIFAGVGNIIKNEVLFRTKIHPESIIEKIPAARQKLLIKEAVNYSFDFLNWKKTHVLKQHWLAHNKVICPRDNIPFEKKYLGKTHRRSFYCTQCQQLYV